jgi:hypothetical protein
MSEADLGGLPLPMPLRWWYRWAGKRSEILGRQNRLLVPRDFERRYNMLRINNGRLCFYDENQGVYQWSTDRTGDDPPVFGRYEGKGRWAHERTTLSEHLILACLFEPSRATPNIMPRRAGWTKTPLLRLQKGFPRWLSDRGVGWSQVFSAAMARSCTQRQTT